MKIATARRIATATAIGTLSVGTAFATTQPGAAGALPPEHQAGEVTYLSGGIGLQEALAITHVAKDYPLELVFVQKAGERNQYLADMPVTIKDQQGKVVFEGRSEGPYFLARLPEGHYVISTNWEDWSFSRKVSVGKQPQRVVFEWRRTPAKSA